jgi:uncharacterized protein GlcG (DUF336 family)
VNLSARFFLLPFLLVALGCGSGGEGRTEGSSRGGSDRANFNCSGECDNQRLSAAEVESILASAAKAAKSLGVGAVVAITDRVGNVLAVATTPGAPALVRFDGAKGASGGLEGALVPATLAAISKAGTGAFLSSQGNAFSTATASLIIQENFLPGEDRAPGGPLFGVQFSQLPCSDLMVLPVPVRGRVFSSEGIGPKALPLGLSGDPGGFPLYKNGDVVGGIGVEVDGLYTIDTAPRERKQPVEELVALSGSLGFEAPSERTADNIFIAGKNLVYSSVLLRDLPALDGVIADYSLTPVPPFFKGAVREGAQFGTPGSGYVRSSRAGVPTLELVDGSLSPRYPTRDATPLSGGEELKRQEIDAILDSAIRVAGRVRTAIRRPLDSSARVTVFIVDTAGSPVGFVRSNDAPVFGTDVALQKARTALFFSSARLSGDAKIRAEQLLGVPFELAFSSRAVGNLSRPFFPDGVNGNPPGPFSRVFPGEWSPFNTGYQLDLILGAVVAPLSGTIPGSCSDISRNGVQIFAGGVPLFRGETLVGAIGVSGDGIDQDDMVAFYGASRRGLDEAGHTGVGNPELGFNAPKSRRSDSVGERGNLRYVNCPEAPFIGSNTRNVCEGL